MKIIIAIAVVATTVLFLGCSTCVSDNTNGMQNNNTKKSLKDFISEKYGKNYKSIENNTKTFIIIIENTKVKKSPVIDTNSFFVFNYEKEEIIFEGNMLSSIIFWEDNNTFRVGRVPGMIKKDSETPSVVGGYSVNVLTGKKIFR